MSDYRTQTLHYYETRADSFIAGTRKADFSDIQNRFLCCVKKPGPVLDFGCGSGRDARAFQQAGYQTEAVDGSQEMAKAAQKYSGVSVKCMDFLEFESPARYQGIWACASLLHLSRKDLQAVLLRLSEALVEDGVLYMSFKYGTGKGFRNGRWFQDQTEETMKSLLSTCPELKLKDMWISLDVRPQRADEKWLNVLVSKRKDIRYES